MNPVGSPVKVVKVCFAYVVKPFTGEVVKVCSGPKVRAWGQVFTGQRKEGRLDDRTTSLHISSNSSASKSLREG